MPLNINAKQQSISLFLSNNIFIIPPYQRPYSWGNDECSTLWDDLESHDFKNSNNKYYFLGNVVLAKENENDEEYHVIDGQQRIVTVSLLLRALYTKYSKSNKLRTSLYLIDDMDDDQKINGIRITSRVNGKNESQFLDAILNPETQPPEDERNNFICNYYFFANKINQLDIDDYKEFTTNVLNHVVLLPIECGTSQQALTIFQTINNRGLSLSDSDIFKSTLFEIAKQNNKEKEFEDDWNELVEDSNNFIEKNGLKIKGDFLTYLFRCYMHVLRAKHKDYTKTVNLRDFYEGSCLDSQKKRISNDKYNLSKMSWDEVISNLKKILESWEYILNTNTHPRCWWEVIKQFGNDAPFYPALIFLFKNLDYNNEYSYLPKTKYENCVKVFKNLARYCYAKKFHSSIEGSTVEDTMYKASVAIYHSNNYSHEKIWVHQDFIKKLSDRLNPNYRRSFSTILMYLAKEQSYVPQGLDVEHILPKKWENNYYDSWEAEKVEKIQETIGNLVLFEKPRNIKGGNKFFNNKKEHYKESLNLQVQSLCKLDQWNYENYINRHEDCIHKLKNFFEG